MAVIVSLAVRVAPLVTGGDRLRYQCITEDGYLMLTIARNLALGKGFAISDGQIATNGTQPLMTFVYAACFKAVGGERLRGLYPVVGVQACLSIVTALALYSATKRCFYRGPRPEFVALLAAGLWFASPSSVMHSQNGLETGLCALLIVVSAATYDMLVPRLAVRISTAHCVLLGAILGAAFLGRNDACLLIAALLAVHLLRGWRNRRTARAVVQAGIIGAASVFVSLPWLGYNVTRFGHLVPVSGRAEALNVEWGRNLWPAFVALVENASLGLRIPAALQDRPATQAVCVAAVLGLLVLAWRRRRWLGANFSAGVGVLACFLAALVVYYAGFFGMPSFLGRYFFVAVTLAAIVASGLVVAGLTARTFRTATTFAIVAGLILAIGLDLRIYRRGTEHMHAQVVNWVAANVDDATWVGAVQTGTLGFYHARTVNLDGKVDPHALAYRQQDRICDYVIARHVEYIVDWAGIAVWSKRPEFAANYRLLLRDEARNLAVLARIHHDRATAPDTGAGHAHAP